MDHLEFVLLDISAPLIEEWQLALKKYLPRDIQTKFTITQLLRYDLQRVDQASPQGSSSSVLAYLDRSGYSIFNPRNC